MKNVTINAINASNASKDGRLRCVREQESNRPKNCVTSVRSKREEKMAGLSERKGSVSSVCCTICSIIVCTPYRTLRYYLSTILGTILSTPIDDGTDRT
jgi:hypothetical protein